MKHFFILLRHEIGVLLINPATYVATVVFLVLMGFLFQGLLTNYSRDPSEVSPAVGFFQLFWVPIFFLTPLLTMHSLADERRRGTIETLLTTPVTTAEVVLAKFGASYLFYLLLWASTGSFHWVLYRFAENPAAIDTGPLVGGYAFVALIGLTYVAMGLFASSITRSQLVAALAALALCIVFTLGLGLPWFADYLSLDAAGDSMVAAVVEHVRVFQHAQDFVSGVFDTRAPVLYVSLAGFWLFLTMLALDARSART